MINIIQSKVFFCILFLIVGYGVGIVKPIKIQFFEATTDDYGVPIIKDYMNPVVDGVPMSRNSFLKKYCVYAKSDTCDFVNKAEAIASVHYNDSAYDKAGIARP